MKRFAYLSTIALLVLVAHSAVSEEKKERLSLFNGKDLEGWTCIQCEASAHEGDLFIESGNGLVQSEQQYSDFIWEFEWKALAEDDWDSGFYFRYTDLPEGIPWPKLYQANLRKGMEGNVNELKGASSEGLLRDREWNRFKLTVVGTKATLEINGEPAWESNDVDQCSKGYIAFQAEVPGGGQHRFRNIFITPLNHP
jgi:hypothetical protein